MNHPLFSSRGEAGRLLAGRIATRGFRQPAVLALPGPGMEIALEVARSLRAPLDVVVPARLDGVERDECACFAWAEPAGAAGVADSELRRRERAFRRGRPALDLAGYTCLLADDGSATDAELRAALCRVRTASPRRLVLVTPIVRGTTLAVLRDEFDGCIRLFESADAREADAAFREPGSRSDAEVAEILERAWRDGAE